MSSERGNFRARILGGFDRRDVISYIEKLSAERNELKREISALRDRLAEEQETNSALKSELTALSLEKAKEIIHELKIKHEALCDFLELKLNSTLDDDNDQFQNDPKSDDAYIMTHIDKMIEIPEQPDDLP